MHILADALGEVLDLAAAAAANASVVSSTEKKSSPVSET
jgi:hypothetical protein